ncbi:Crp/Fnr family transcriptional regulator [Flavobacterium artemisiae]|uniref:Crp/Fnr family transcriptional regulator n=1 Tax=Flavobacterium artemisiae TaxID=2126556 RepID=A0ABW4HIW4_9FLAO
MKSQAESIQKLKEIFERREFPAKTLLVNEGTVAQNIYYIENGAARVWLHHEGKEITVQFLFEGGFIASIESIISGEKSWYAIETIEPVILYSISTADFKKKIEQLPHVREFYYRYIQQSLLSYQKRMVSQIKNTPEERYKEMLREFPEIIRRVPQHYIASYLGITSVSLSRIRNRK